MDPVVSERMRRIRTKGTRPERLLRRALRAQGIKYRNQARVLGSRPDIVIPKARIAIFVDGCFWHGCPVHYREPKTNVGFWRDKISTNRARDRRLQRELERRGWVVLRFWECSIGKDPAGAALAVGDAMRDRCSTGG